MVQKVINEKHRTNDKDGISISYSLDENSLYVIYHVKKCCFNDFSRQSNQKLFPQPDFEKWRKSFSFIYDLVISHETESLVELFICISIISTSNLIIFHTRAINGSPLWYVLYKYFLQSSIKKSYLKLIWK